MNKVYGYCRISTPKQNIERQVRNILKEYPEAIIVQETFTGSRFQGRRELKKLLCSMQAGDTIIEVDDLHQRTREGIETVRQNEKQNSSNSDREVIAIN